TLLPPQFFPSLPDFKVHIQLIVGSHSCGPKTANSPRTFAPPGFGAPNVNDNLLDEAVEFLDKSFENAFAGPVGGDTETRQADEAVVQDLFVQIAASYA